MPSRSIASGTVSFGLVSIPIRVFVATHSEQVSFHMLHEKCGTRVRQQLYCPHCKRVVERDEIVKGYEARKGRNVTFTNEELKALEAEVSRSIEIQEFVPFDTVDPIYFQDAHYLGPEKGAGKPYHLLVDAMRDTDKVAVAQYAHHGKEHLVLIRPHRRGLVLHTMYYADEVRSIDDVTGEAGKPSASEVQMARKLVEQLAGKEFRPDAYKDLYRRRLEDVIRKKAKGETVTAPEPEAERAGRVVNLMDALKQSLAGAKRPHAARAASRGGAKRGHGGTRQRTPRSPGRAAS